MKETKRRLETFSFYDRTGLEAHLARMAEEGWLLDKIGQFLWHYRRIEPKKLTFSVTYFPKASAFDPEPSEEQETFYDFCRHTGWVLAASSAQLQVFYNEGPDPVPIETDPVLEVESIHRTMKRSFLPSQLMLLAVAVLDVGLLVCRLIDAPIGLLASPASVLTAMCWVLVFVLTGVELGGYFWWHRKAVKAAEQGEFLDSRSHRKLQIGALALLGLGVVYYMLSVALSGSRMMMAVAVLMFCVYMPGLFLLVRGVMGWLKGKKVPAKVNRVVTIVSGLVAAYLFVGGITFGVLFGSTHGWFAEQDEETYEYHGNTFTAAQDQLPLTVEDLLDVEYEGYSREHRGRESIFLAQYQGYQRARFDAGQGLGEILMEKGDAAGGEIAVHRPQNRLVYNIGVFIAPKGRVEGPGGVHPEQPVEAGLVQVDQPGGPLHLRHGLIDRLVPVQVPDSIKVLRGVFVSFEIVDQGLHVVADHLVNRDQVPVQIVDNRLGGLNGKEHGPSAQEGLAVGGDPLGKQGDNLA